MDEAQAVKIVGRELCKRGKFEDAINFYTEEIVRKHQFELITLAGNIKKVFLKFRAKILPKQCSTSYVVIVF